jgi:type I restriction enzyme S subunit
MFYETKQVKLSDAIDLISGGTPKTSVKEYWDGEIDWLSVVDFNADRRYVSKASKKITESGLKNSATNMLRINDVIISARGTVGALAQLKKSMAFNQSCYGVRGRLGIADTSYIYYVLKNTVKRLKEVSHGAVFDTITRNTFELITIDLPDLVVQKKIASVLGALDDKIELLQDANRTLESIAQAIFKSWFIDFDPMHVKHQGKEYIGIDKAIADLFPDSFVESELGLIPKGWAVGVLGDFLSPRRGKTITKSVCTEGEIPVVAGGLDPAYFHNTSNVIGPAITISASGANAGFVRLYQQNIWASDCSYISSEQTNELFYWYVFLKYNQEKIYSMQQGAAQPHIYASDLMRLKAVLSADNKLVNSFNTLVTPLFNSIARSTKQIESLSNLRDTLLPRLISGKLDLSKIEAQLEEVE